MSTVYRFKARKLDLNFLEQIKATFGNKEIEIIVSECDETEYLLKSEVNKTKLLKAIENLKDRQNLVEVDKTLMQVMAEISDRAQQRGLTPEILQEVLADNNNG